MALSEGWAYYNEWRVAQKYLNFNSFTNKNWSDDKYYPSDFEQNDDYFPRYYSALFYELSNIGCSINAMERAMSTNSISVFKNNLVVSLPTLKNDIEEIIAKYE